MKKLLFIFLFAELMGIKAQNAFKVEAPGTTYNISTTTVGLLCPSTSTFYDSGGSGGSYANNENFTMTFTVPAGNCLTFNFTAFNTESCCDRLRIFDGPTGASPLIGTYAGLTGPGIITSSGGALTFSFTSDGSVVNPGWTAVVQCTTCPPPPPPPSYYLMSNVNQTLTCPPTFSLFYDSGGPSTDYVNSENYTKTFTAPVGSCLTFNFTSFNTESCCDRLRVFDGPNGASPLMGIYSGLTGPGSITSSGSSLTFSFTSDGSITAPGWTANIACAASCTGAPVAGTTIASPSLNCVTYTSNLSLSGNVAGCGLTYQWQSATALAGPYSNLAGLTTPSANVSSSVTSFYRCVLSCAGTTAASSPATCSLTPAGLCGICAINSVTLPYSSGPQTTCGSGNDVTSLNVTNICGSSSYYGGEDAVYSFTPLSSGALTLGVTSAGSFMGLMLYSGCPISGGTCAGNAQGFAGNQTLCVNVVAGTTYYLIIDSWPAPTCNPYNLSISAPGPCVGSINGVTATASPTTACGTLTTNLALSGLTACGATYQWQVSLAVGGPYTNVAGGNVANLTTTTSSSNFYRCLLTCGASTALSTVVQTSVSTFTAPPCSLASYVAASITYSIDVFVGTILPTTDDVLFSALSLFGFNFCYAGQQFSGGYVASNSSFVFDGITCFPNIGPMPGAVYAAPGIGTGWSISTPAPTTANSTPRNAILGPWHDINPGAGGVMRYGVLGLSPNRRFVVSFENVTMFSCTTMSFTGQIKLFESSNNIEIHIGNKPLCSTWNAGNAIMGLHNYDGTIYIPPVNATAHNAPTQWTMTAQAYRFTTSCPGASCTPVLPIGFKNLYGQQMEGINKLWWETTDEENIKEFIVERSLDATNFTPINLTGSLGKPSTYLFNDNTFKHGYINYYRVTALDKSGKKTSTSIYPIFNTEDKILINAVYPNPATDKLSIDISGRGANADCNFIIYDQFGRIVLQKNRKISMGTNLVDIEIESLNKGIYIIEIKSDDNSIISKQKFTKM